MNQRIRVLQDLGKEFERAVQAPPHRERSRFSIGRTLHVPSAALVPTMAVVVAIGIVLAAVVLLRPAHHPNAVTTSPPSSTAPGAAGRQQLIDTLAVLRRPQTHADLHSPAIARFLARYRSSGQSPPLLMAQGTPDLPLIRRAATTPWGTVVFVIPMKPLTAASRAALKVRYPNFPVDQFQRLSQEAIDLQVGYGGGCCASAADIRAGHDGVTEGAGRSFAGGSTQTRFVLLVPDGVAKVQFVFPRQPSRTQPGSPIYTRPLRVTVPVHGNIAAVQVKRECCAGEVPMIWYAADGRVIKRIGNPAAANRVQSPPKPGPQTAQSRAAKRDPSTPNHVWVTPASGGPHAKYAVHFRLLLNDADYRFHVSGTRCPQITYAGGGGGGSGDLRGRILSYDLDAVTGQTWCPGTYHVAASVMDLGRYGNLKHPAKPFGTATFTVRR